MRNPRKFAMTLLVIVLGALCLAGVALALRFTDDSYVMPTGTVGAPYFKKLDGAGGCGPALPYQYRIILGQTPPGTGLAKDGTISGNPAQAGTWSFWVELSDQDPPSASWCVVAKSQREFAIAVSPGTTSTTPTVTGPTLDETRKIMVDAALALEAKWKAQGRSQASINGTRIHLARVVLQTSDSYWSANASKLKTLLGVTP